MDQTLVSSNDELPEEWQRKYRLHVINMNEPITITEEQKNTVLQYMSEGKRFIVLGEYTIMTNSIQFISPRYGPDNIPVRPRDEMEYLVSGEKTNVNEKKQKVWDRFFSRLLSGVDQERKNELIGKQYIGELDPMTNTYIQSEEKVMDKIQI